MINCGDVATQRAWARANKLWDSDKKIYGENSWKISYFSRFVQIHFGTDFQSLVIRMSLLFLVKGGHLSHEEFYDLLSGRKREVREPFLYLLFLKCLQLKIINMLKQHIFGVACSEPLQGLSTVPDFLQLLKSKAKT